MSHVSGKLIKLVLHTEGVVSEMAMVPRLMTTPNEELGAGYAQNG